MKTKQIHTFKIYRGNLRKSTGLKGYGVSIDGGKIRWAPTFERAFLKAREITPLQA